MMKHRYDHVIDPNGGSAAARLARMIAPGLRVLELGSGPGAVTRILHQKGCRVTAIDLDTESLELCRSFCERVIQADLTQEDSLQAVTGEHFDVIVMADILEHLPNPKRILDGLAPLLTNNGYVMLSLPNASHLSVLACLLNGRFPYQDKGLLDATHLRFFGRKDIEQMLLASGLLWQCWETADLPPEQSELRHYWLALSEADRSVLLHRAVDGQVYQHVIKAYPSTETGQIAKLQADLLESSGKNSAQTRVIATLEAERNLQAEAIAALETAVALERGLTAQILNSHSWRLTEPLRYLKRKLAP